VIVAVRLQLRCQLEWTQQWVRQLDGAPKHTISMDGPRSERSTRRSARRPSRDYRGNGYVHYQTDLQQHSRPCLEKHYLGVELLTVVFREPHQTACLASKYYDCWNHSKSMSNGMYLDVSSGGVQGILVRTVTTAP
jgi:hypothetical protein